nr:uncharacterized protein CFP56_37509 [Quercus suber]
MTSSSFLSLSSEEQAELVRSNKKVKNVYHAGFSDSSDSRPSSPNQTQGMGSRAISFKDKVVGEIPGVYSQAFNFGDLMEDDEEIEDELEALREGLVAVKFPRELKQKIRNPWAKALIVKVLDCVDLGFGFFLIRLSLKEDLEAVLQNGPWFIGEHFLSIRPWEPDFKPELANVSSIAVWIRLSGLPIEYYNAEALYLIGKAIGNVLRVDTHIASEARGRFARLCVQVDVTKPLITAIKIGKLEQTVCYEGIQRLCFDCGRVGHKRESCPYTVRQEMPPKEMAGMDSEKNCTRSCNSRGANADKVVEGPSGILHVNVQGNVEDNVQDSMYGPWIVVKRKVNGAKNKSSNMGPQARHYAGNVQWSKDGYSRSEPVGPSREIKRKISPTKVRNGAQGAGSVTDLDGFKELKGLTFSSLSPKLTDNGKKAFKVEKAKGITKPSLQASVKGKKALARSRAATNVVDRRDFSPEVLLANHAPSSTSVPSCAPFHGVSVQGTAAEAQLAIIEESKHDGGDFKERACRSLCAPDLGLELVHSSEVESMEDDGPVNRSKLDEGRCRSNGLDVDGHGQSVVGMSIEGAGFECNPEGSFEATRLGLEGGVKDPMSY